MIATPDDVLSFWFDEGPTELFARVKRWFMGGPDFDAEVISRFADNVHAALAGELDGWAESPRERLALVLVLDQFTRNVFRGDPRTYSGDPKAQALVIEAYDAGMDRELERWEERLFLSMPLLHSEELALHERLGSIVEDIYAQVPEEQQVVVASSREQVLKYRDIITRFGRFPHRNGILGREPTPEEEAFMVDFAKRAAPSAFRKG